jgi:NitT/TauT family transport system permease protein
MTTMVATRRPRRASVKRAARAGLWFLSLLLGIAIWQLGSLIYGPLLVASPKETLSAAGELAGNGTLFQAALVSLRRIGIGWGLGLLVGIPLGILMGRIRFLRLFLDPYIEFFRFIPPIAFVTLAIVWFGIGETSKVILIFYTGVFIVTLNTIAGVAAIPESRLRAAESLGASRHQILTRIVLPSTVPHLVTGARLALANCFLTIVSAEIVSANTGLGALLWQARNFGRINWIFVGIVTLGILGYICDRLIRLISTATLHRFGVRF